ncbi:MAG: hypothetical protein AB7I30_22625, partial [Isosphaeraceae bacterium]
HLAVSPDGKALASGDADGVVILWDLTDPHAFTTLDQLGSEPTGLAFSPDGKSLLITGKNRRNEGLARLLAREGGPELARLENLGVPATAGFLPGEGPLRLFLAENAPSPGRSGLRLWNPETRGLQTRTTDLAGVRNVVASPDGQRLAVIGAGTKPVLALIDVQKSRALWRTRLDRVGQAPVFSPDGRRLALTDGRGRTFLVDSATGRITRTLDTPSLGSAFLAFTPDGQTLVEGDPDGIVALTRVDAGERTRVRVPPRLDFWAVCALSPDGQTLATGGRAGLPVTLWRLDPWEERATMPGPPVDARSLAFTPDGRTLILGCGDHRVRLWHLDPPRHPSPAGHPKEVWAIGFTPDGQTLISAGDDWVTRLWDVATGEPRGVLREHSNLVTSLAIDPSGQTLVTGSFDRTAIVYDLATLQPRHVLKGHTNHVRAVAISPDGQTVATAGSDRQIRLWNARTGQPIDTFPAHDGRIRGLAFSHDGRTLVSAANDKFLKVWNLAGPRVPLRIANREQVAAVAFSPDDSLIAAADEEGSVVIFDARTGAAKRRLRSDGKELRCLAFSPDGTRIAAGGTARVARLWDMETGQELLALRGHAKKINALAFDPNARWLATASHDGAVKLWDGRRR